jgi:catechol 2,3-dioxygenase-like lactoylglutathione lyase family enzyme
LVDYKDITKEAKKSIHFRCLISARITQSLLLDCARNRIINRGPAMARLALHHVNVIVTDLPRSLAFYEKLFGLTIIERPPFKNAGAWLGCGALQVHLSVHPPGSFRTGNVDGADTHFAFRTDDFDSALATLTANGFREDAAEDDPMHVMVRRNGPAGFPQLFLLDPDRNIIEINDAP